MITRYSSSSTTFKLDGLATWPSRFQYSSQPIVDGCCSTHTWRKIQQREASELPFYERLKAHVGHQRTQEVLDEGLLLLFLAEATA